MEGLKVNASTRRKKDGVPTRSYSFEELITPIFDRIIDYCWALEGTLVFVAEVTGSVLPNDEELEAMFEAAPGTPAPRDDLRPVWERGWLRPGFLARLAPLIRGDWTNIVGLPYPPVFSRDQVRPNDIAWLETNAAIYVSCVDGAFWEIFVRDKELLSRLKSTFPFSEPTLLRKRGSDL